MSVVNQVSTSEVPGIFKHSVSRPGTTLIAGIIAIVGGTWPDASIFSSVARPCKTPIQVSGTPGYPGKSSVTW